LVTPPGPQSRPPIVRKLLELPGLPSEGQTNELILATVTVTFIIWPGPHIDSTSKFVALNRAACSMKGRIRHFIDWVWGQPQPPEGGRAPPLPSA